MIVPIVPIGTKILLPGHFAEPVVIETVRPIGDSFEVRVRLIDGTVDETILSQTEAEALFSRQTETKSALVPADPEKLRLLVESARIRLAYAHDRHFAVSLSGIRTLPHQIEAVYMKMLPQPRLRFLLADDPGAGKTIMAGLLIKEMKLREAIDRVLILCPAPLTIQWQDEMDRWFGEAFDIIMSEIDRKQLRNPWRTTNQAIASLDYAKQEDVRERVWTEKWDLVIIDEAHKCSAHTKSYSTRSNEVERTKRYQLAEKLSETAEHLILLTATPHHGDDDRFAHFIRLLDPDLFPEPHKMGEKAAEIRRDILRLGPDCPWALRRLKEDLRDIDGKRIFPDRHAHTIIFRLNREEYDLYKAVTAYINDYLPQATGRKKASVALARTVFQRRLASSAMAIYESIRRRCERQEKLLEELESLSPSEAAKRLAGIKDKEVDSEQDDDDLDERQKDELTETATSAVELDQLRNEIAVLTDLLGQARRVRDNAADSKLRALKECLERSEFNELKDGRGKLLLFTEHKDTMKYLSAKLEEWRYTTCNIHGGMDPRERKRAQEQFRTERQICVATEAAGEGINLQFCRLMINYDLPWNPTRLEQRLGRIHRIGQDRDVHAFNFVAADSEEGQPIVEGRILERLLDKLDKMRAVLSDRVFDVIGEILSINEINLPEMLREAASDPRRLDDYLDQIANIDPQKLQAYEQATGIALARAHVDFSGFQKANAEAEEKRLMPRYVEDHFKKAAREVGLRVEQRADNLYRIEHVLADLRSDRLASNRRLGKPEPEYRKATFYKEHLDMDQHLDAVLLGPGHPLYGAVDEKLNEALLGLVGGCSVFVDESAQGPYRLHIFEIAIKGQDTRGQGQTIYAEIAAVQEALNTPEGAEGRFSIVPADLLLDLPSHPEIPKVLEPFDPKVAMDFVKAAYQMEVRERCLGERRHFVEVSRDYLQKSFEARIWATQARVMALRARESREPEVAQARRNAENELVELERDKQTRLGGLDRLTVVRQGPVRHIATALICPSGLPIQAQAAAPEDLDPLLKRRSEKAAEDLVVAYEQGRGWECTRVGNLKIGFDVRSFGPADPQTGYRDPVASLRRIEVKGRTKGNPIRLTTNEWYKAAQLGDSYWLYVVWNPLDNPDRVPVMIQNPVKHLDHAKKEVVSRYYDIPAAAIDGCVHNG